MFFIFNKKEGIFSLVYYKLYPNKIDDIKNIDKTKELNIAIKKPIKKPVIIPAVKPTANPTVRARFKPIFKFSSRYFSELPISYPKIMLATELIIIKNK